MAYKEECDPFRYVYRRQWDGSNHEFQSNPNPALWVYCDICGGTTKGFQHTHD